MMFMLMKMKSTVRICKILHGNLFVEYTVLRQNKQEKPQEIHIIAFVSFVLYIEHRSFLLEEFDYSLMRKNINRNE